MISTTASAAATVSAVNPGPSCLKSMMQRSGQSKVSIGTQPGTLSIALIGMLYAPCPFHEGRHILAVRHVMIAVGHHRTALVPATAAHDVHGIFALRTIDPMFMSCCQFSMATRNGCLRWSRSSTVADIRQYRYRSTTLRVSPCSSSSGSYCSPSGLGSFAGHGPTPAVVRSGRGSVSRDSVTRSFLH